MFGKVIRRFVAIAAVAFGLFAASVPPVAAADGAQVFDQSFCQPSGVNTVCVTYHAVINDVWTDNGTHAFTQQTRAVVTYTTPTGEVLYTYEQQFRNINVYAQGQFKVITAHFTTRVTIPGIETCTQHSDSVYADDVLRFTNVSFVCR